MAVKSLIRMFKPMVQTPLARFVVDCTTNPQQIPVMEFALIELRSLKPKYWHIGSTAPTRKGQSELTGVTQNSTVSWSRIGLMTGNTS